MFEQRTNTSFLPIHREASAFVEQATKHQILILAIRILEVWRNEIKTLCFGNEYASLLLYKVCTGNCVAKGFLDK